MTIQTSVPEDFVVPTTFNVFNFVRAGGARTQVPLTVAMIATKSAAGTAVAGVIYEVTDAAQTDALSGINSEGAIMCRKALETKRLLGRGPRLVVTFIAEPGGGTANVQTITFVGAATSDGNVIVRVAGRTFVVGVHNGDSQNTIASAVSNSLKAKAETLPVTVSVAANVVTLTHPTKGVNGKDVIVAVTQQIAGSVGTVATTAVGAGASDISTALTALSPLRYDGIAIANHTTTDITAIASDILVRWAPESKTWGWYFLFEPGTIGTATTLAAAANTKEVVVANMEGCLNAAGEGAVATAVLAFSRSRPNSIYDRAKVPLFPPGDATWYTAPERNTAIKAGLTVYVGVTDSSGAITEDRAKMVQMVTTKTTIGSNPDDRLRDLAVSRVGVNIAIELDAAVDELQENNPDGIPRSVAKKLYTDLAAAIMRAKARANPPILRPDLVEQDVSQIEMEGDDNVLSRLNGKLPYHPDLPDHQVAWYHDVIIGG